jgi:hypothetical protein
MAEPPQCLRRNSISADGQDAFGGPQPLSQQADLKNLYISGFPGGSPNRFQLEQKLTQDEIAGVNRNHLSGFISLYNFFLQTYF